MNKTKQILDRASSTGGKQGQKAALKQANASLLGMGLKIQALAQIIDDVVEKHDNSQVVLNAVDDKSVALVKLLVKKGLITTEELQAQLDQDQSETFARYSQAEDEKLGLLVYEGPVEAGHFVDVELSTESDARLPRFIRFCHGAQNVDPKLQQSVLGLKVGDVGKFEVAEHKVSAKILSVRVLPKSDDTAESSKQEDAPQAIETPTPQE